MIGLFQQRPFTRHFHHLQHLAILKAIEPTISLRKVGSEIVALSSGYLAVASTTLKPGDPVLSIDGTPVSLGTIAPL